MMIRKEDEIMTKKHSKSKRKTNKKNKTFSFNLIELISLICILLALGALIGSIITCNRESIIVSTVPKELEEFVTTYNNLYHHYYKDVSQNKLMDAAIEGMLNSLDDPYSLYMNQEDAEEFNETVNSEYTGIGITVQVDNDKVEVLSIFKSSPAERAGIKIGDRIIEINQESISNKSSDEISHLMENSNKKISIKISRDGKEYTYHLKKTTVDIPTVNSKVITSDDKKIGYLSISVFSSNTYKEFSNELKKLEKKKIESLIIDVRNNPGGHVDQVNRILDLFLDKKKVLYQISNTENKKIYASTKEKRTYKIAVLINKNSASASEILAASIKESYKGTVVGVNSYGKGSVQKQYKLSSGASVKYTVKKWLTPKGNSIDQVGVEPNTIIEQSEEYYNHPTDENDIQLQKAIESLK